jgi:hypothetical protein
VQGPFASIGLRNHRPPGSGCSAIGFACLATQGFYLKLVAWRAAPQILDAYLDARAMDCLFSELINDV